VTWFNATRIDTPDSWAKDGRPQKASFMPLVEKLAGSGLAAGKQTPYAPAWIPRPSQACKNLSTSL
jgi:hypothetical protein